MKRRDAVRGLEEAGCEYDYARGSHVYYVDPVTRFKIPVAKHGSRNLTEREAASV